MLPFNGCFFLLLRLMRVLLIITIYIIVLIRIHLNNHSLILQGRIHIDSYVRSNKTHFKIHLGKKSGYGDILTIEY